MPATFSRLKIWVAEVLDYAALNAEFDNILNNLSPTGIGSYSANLAQYRTVTSPIDGTGNPQLPNSLAGEIERLRYQIQQILGADADYWYESPTATLSGLAGIIVGNSVPASRIEGISSISYANILLPSGTVPTVTLKGSTNPIVYYVQGVRYTLNTDVSLTGMSVASGASNTALFIETAESGLHTSSYLGEHDTTLLIGTVGSAISSSSGIQAFKVVRGGTTEYFTAQYLSDTTDGAMLEKAQRGKFYNASNLPAPKTIINTGDTFTFLKLAWIFLKTNGTLTLTYNTPSWAFIQPLTPNIGDFWFDLSTTTWKNYSALGFLESEAVFVGQAVLDTVACVAARGQEPFKIYSAANELDLDITPDGLALRPKNPTTSVSVYGFIYYFGPKITFWSASNLEVAGALAANTTYYAYIKESGNFVLSLISPMDRRGDLAGYYHPSYSWRCVGHAKTNGSSIFYKAKIVSFALNSGRSFFAVDFALPGQISTMFADTTTSPDILAPGYLFANGAALSRGLYRKLRSVLTAGIPGTFTITGTTTNGSPTITNISPALSSFTLITGLSITGAGISAGNLISAITVGTSSTITSFAMTNNATASAAGVTLSLGFGNGSTTFTLPSMARTQGQWTQYVPSVSGMGVSAYAVGEYRLDGEECEIRFTANIVNTIANGNNPNVGFPAGITSKTIDTGIQIHHTGTFYDASAVAIPFYYPMWILISDGASSLGFYYLTPSPSGIGPVTIPTGSSPPLPTVGDKYQGYVRFKYSGGPTFGEQRIIKAII